MGFLLGGRGTKYQVVIKVRSSSSLLMEFFKFGSVITLEQENGSVNMDNLLFKKRWLWDKLA